MKVSIPEGFKLNRRSTGITDTWKEAEMERKRDRETRWVRRRVKFNNVSRHTLTTLQDNFHPFPLLFSTFFWPLLKI